MTESDPNPYASPITTAPPLSPADEKSMALLTHLTSIFFGAIAAAIFYVLFRERGPFVRAHTVTELNFQITVLLVSAAGFVLCFVGTFFSFATATSGSGGMVTPVMFLIGWLLIFVTRIVAAIFGIVATIAANRGQFYEYPVAIKFVK